MLRFFAKPRLAMNPHPHLEMGSYNNFSLTRVIAKGHSNNSVDSDVLLLYDIFAVDKFEMACRM